MSKKPVLTFLSPEALEERLVPVAAIDTLLPCRKYLIEHKVATLGKVALTTEFLLRLLRASEGMVEEDIGSFFGFSHHELAFVLRDVERLGFVERGDGKAWITPQGLAVFREGKANPEIFDVEKRQETHGFDLLSLAPQRPTSISPFQRRLPELKLTDPKFVSHGAQEVHGAFRRYFRELSRERDRDILNRRSLYSVDRVSAGERFMSVVEINVSVSNTQPAQAQTDLSAWRVDEAELEDRPEIQTAAANLVRSLDAPCKPDDALAYETLVASAPEFLKEYTRRDGLSVERYFREAAARAGEVRADRPTAAIVGSFFLRKNLATWFDVVSYGAQDGVPVKGIVWLPPAVNGWGASVRLPEVLLQLKQQFKGADDESPATVSLVQQRSEARQLQYAFDQVATLSYRPTPAALECLLVPNVACAVLVHAPIKGNLGFPIPLGIMSFDPPVVARAREIIVASAAGLGSDAQDLVDLIS